jgi:halocyanin-like protein
MNERTTSRTRRQILRLGALVGTTSIAGCAAGGGAAGDGGSGDGGSETTTRTPETGGGDGGSATTTSTTTTTTTTATDDGGDSGSDESYEAWLSNVGNYDGETVDRTGADSVTVIVGGGDGLVFEPPAVRVTTGTTVVWEWSGKGGQHNVKAEDGSFESELATAEGTTFEHTFEEAGAVPYLCVPHQVVGMKGVVDVVDG